MAAELPLKIRVDIRDAWDSKNSALQEAVESLTKVLGYTVVPVVEWSSMWEELKDRFPDKATFVPTIARFVISWYDILTERLENETYSEWTDKLVEVLSEAAHGNSLKLTIEPCPPKVPRPNTKWSTKSKAFYLGIPNTEPPSAAGIISALEKDFDSILEASNGPVPQDDDGWADVMQETVQSTPAYPTSQPSSRPAPPQPPSTARLPTLPQLSRPSELFSTTAPYILTISPHENQIWVQCSHEPSLELLSSYIQKWARTNSNDSAKRPVLKVDRRDSDFFSGVMDMLVIEPTLSHYRNVRLNPATVLAFVEGVLGYKLAFTDGSYWMYRSETILK